MIIIIMINSNFEIEILRCLKKINFICYIQNKMNIYKFMVIYYMISKMFKYFKVGDWFCYIKLNEKII